MMKMLVEDWK